MHQEVDSQQEPPGDMACKAAAYQRHKEDTREVVEGQQVEGRRQEQGLRLRQGQAAAAK